MSGIPAETLLLCLVCGVFLGFAFAVLEFLRLLFSLGKIAAAVTDVLFCLLPPSSRFCCPLRSAPGTRAFFRSPAKSSAFYACRSR